MKAFFNDDGTCLGITNADTPPEGITTFLDVPEDTSPEDIWYDGSFIQDRQELNIPIPEKAPVGTPITFPVPQNTVIIVNGERYTEGVVRLETNSEAAFSIRSEGAKKVRQRVEVKDQDKIDREEEIGNWQGHPLRKMPPGKIDQYIEDNVTDLEDVKAMLKVIAKAAFVGR